MGVRESIKADDFDSRLAGLGVNVTKVREVIATRTIRKTLELSDAMLNHMAIYMAIRTNPKGLGLKRVKQALSEELADVSTDLYKLFKKFPMSGLKILKQRRHSLT